jgi:hypothetical protein
MADQKQITQGNAGVSTQVANPSRASWRTFVQSLVGYFVIVNAALPIIQSTLQANPSLLSRLFGHYYGDITIAVNIVGLVVAAVTKGVALLMTIPAVDRWITKYLPKLAAIEPEAGE